MARVAYIVPGYGVPRTPKQMTDIDSYVASVRSVIGAQISDALVVLSGGATASTPPYDDTEAACLESSWSKYNAAKPCQLLIESEAICTLENILLARKLLAPIFQTGKIKVFVENIRLQRMQVICDALLQGFEVEIIPIDLGHQADAAALEGERLGILWIKWALASPENFIWYRNVFADKISAAKEADSQGRHFDAVGWWQTKWTLIRDRLAVDGYLV